MDTTNPKGVAAPVERPVARGILETAAACGLSPGYVRLAIDRGELKRTRVGRRVLVKDSDLLQWLNRNDEAT